MFKGPEKWKKNKNLWVPPLSYNALVTSLQTSLLKNNNLSCAHIYLDSGVHLSQQESFSNLPSNLLMPGFLKKLRAHPQDQENNLHMPSFLEERTIAFQR